MDSLILTLGSVRLHFARLDFEQAFQIPPFTSNPPLDGSCLHDVALQIGDGDGRGAVHGT